MADHNVTLTYAASDNAGAVVADPFTITVSPGQTVAFSLGPGSLAGSIRITFHDRQFFAVNNGHFHNDGVLHGGDGVVTVVARPSQRTTYHCELLDAAGHVRARSHERAGGEILPAN